MYYRDYINPNALTVSNTAGSKFLAAQYHHFGKEFTQYIHLAGDFHSTNGFDSLHVSYGDNFVHQLIGYGDKNYEHFAFTFHNLNTVLSLHLYMRETKRYNKNGERIGVWNHYENGEIVRTEQYLKPWKESADVVKH